MRKFRTSAVDAGQALGAWLEARLGDPGAPALVTRGAVYVDGRRVRDPEAPLAAGQAITVHEPSTAAEAATDAPPAATWKVIRRNKDVLVVDKPVGMPSQATREDAANALDALVATRFPGARLLHRLDRDASGLVLFTRRDETRAMFQDALADGRITREYAAVCAGLPAVDSFTLDAPIGRDPRDTRRRAARVSGGEVARTHVKVVKRGADAALLAVTLETGRTHQIRVHLADAGHPLLGDPLYAPPAVRARASRLLLHAVRLTWPGGEAESRPPPDFAVPGLAV